ncbi:hypothetical protein M441DRAFT_51685 [Trichoderma asperellum CBS 433.97]|uniref:Uncharacterized protein n=1 Tax=Trichoderma asperellum (strain ATCC 204424 / CBS 433.97 / NBRC 101777) TaxID=1042311 RepID=A0A2T3YU11_TRIA4|nr:hypothetical protein M441DRAFT_51685 [Trichoderma asperellum CBS 433.97]PTB36019.1 hypothetical protein M441DRAFT_51685 [Trichoderma asperellum CBS 433.97]
MEMIELVPTTKHKTNSAIRKILENINSSTLRQKLSWLAECGIMARYMDYHWQCCHDYATDRRRQGSLPFIHSSMSRRGAREVGGGRDATSARDEKRGACGRSAALGRGRQQEVYKYVCLYGWRFEAPFAEAHNSLFPHPGSPGNPVAQALGSPSAD